MTDKKKIIVAVTGASGACYARLLTAKLLERGLAEVSVITTDRGGEVMRFEENDRWLDDPRIVRYDNRDLFAPPASGSARFDAMVVVPCSMGSLGRIAAGLADDLVARAADVVLKERRTLIVVPREAPYSTLHLRNMTALSECGAIVCPASPSFYSRPATLDALCETITDRIVSLLGFDPGGYVWS